MSKFRRGVNEFATRADTLYRQFRVSISWFPVSRRRLLVCAAQCLAIRGFRNQLEIRTLSSCHITCARLLNPQISCDKIRNVASLLFKTKF